MFSARGRRQAKGNQRITVRNAADLAAIESGLTGAGLEAARFGIAASETENVVHVRNEGDAATAKRALQGMSIRYDIRQDARRLP